MAGTGRRLDEHDRLDGIHRDGDDALHQAVDPATERTVAPAPWRRRGWTLAAVLVGAAVAGAFAWQNHAPPLLPPAVVPSPPVEPVPLEAVPAAAPPVAVAVAAPAAAAEDPAPPSLPAEPPPAIAEPPPAQAEPPETAAPPESPPEAGPPPGPMPEPDPGPVPDPVPEPEPAVPAPAPAPPEPARPPVAAIRAEMRTLSCALVTVEEVNGRVLVSGTVAGEAAFTALREALDRGAAGWEHGLDVAVAAPGLCAPLTLLAAPLAANAALTAALGLQVTGGGALHGGEPLILDILAPSFPVHLRIDYFTTDGNVVHLLPNPLELADRLDAGVSRRLGERGAGGRFWSIGPPFGRELVLALATPTALFAALRPEVEPAAIYLADLKRALAALAPGTAPLASALFLATAP